jgi:hypothetical protein
MHDGYFSFSMLTIFQRFSLNLLTNKSAQHVKRCNSIWNCSASRPHLSIQARLFIIQVPFLMINHILKILAYDETPNYRCAILWVYPKFLQIKKHSIPLNDSLHLLFPSLTFRCAEMFNYTDNSWKSTT